VNAGKTHPGVFARFARASARSSGKPLAFVLATTIVLLWAVTGPLFGFSDTWQLVINTGTTIVTFLMVFLIQSTQNTDTVAVQLKLDELIRTASGARNSMLTMEDMDPEDLDRMRRKYEALADRARHAGESRGRQKNRSRPTRKRRSARQTSR
jgi:low affinity Fe/Cu permease